MDRVGLCVASDIPSPEAAPGLSGTLRDGHDPVRDTKCPDKEELKALCSNGLPAMGTTRRRRSRLFSVQTAGRTPTSSRWRSRSAGSS